MKYISKNSEYFIKQCADLFLQATGEMKAVMHNVDNNVTMRLHFDRVLLLIYPVLILEDLRAIELLIKEHIFLSASKISRSMLEICATVSWLYQLPYNEQDSYAKSFMEFGGRGFRFGKTSTTYTWLETITEKSIKEIIISQALDRKDIVDFSFTTESGNPFKLSFYDLLSKIIHYNPKALKKIVGMNDEGTQGFLPDYVSICLATVVLAIYSLTQFCVIFFEYLSLEPEQEEGKIFFSILKNFMDRVHVIVSDYKP